MAKSLVASSPSSLISDVTTSRSFIVGVFSVSYSQVRNGERRVSSVPLVRCSSADSENQVTMPPPWPPRKGGPPYYTWSSLIRGIGVVETAYLTYVKVTSSVALCALLVAAAAAAAAMS